MANEVVKVQNPNGDSVFFEVPLFLVNYRETADSDGRVFIDTPNGCYAVLATAPSANPRSCSVNWNGQTIVYAPLEKSQTIEGTVLFMKATEIGQN